MDDLPTKPLTKEPVIIKQEPVTPQVRQASSYSEKKPRLSLVERQSLNNTSNARRRTSALHKPLPQQDVFRFPSESPERPVHAKHPKPPTEDKENRRPASNTTVVARPGPSTPTSVGPGMVARERRKTFNSTMEKLAQMARDEMQADKDWEANLKRRRSVAI